MLVLSPSQSFVAVGLLMATLPWLQDTYFKISIWGRLAQNTVPIHSDVTAKRYLGRSACTTGSWKWKPIPIGVGIFFLAYVPLRRRVQRQETTQESNSVINNEWEYGLDRMLPLRSFSRFWGWIHSVDLPIFLRSPLLGVYVRAFECNMEEAQFEELAHYRNLKELFQRALKPGVRPVCPINQMMIVLDFLFRSMYNACYLLLRDSYRRLQRLGNSFKCNTQVSPCDGRIVSAGEVMRGEIEQVKGITYPLSEFLGATAPSSKNLSQVTIYLAPGDYHRFHSPTDWKVTQRTHFPGALMSVGPVFSSFIKRLFVRNERVSYTGSWQHGFFSVTPVGATNVGSISVYFDKNLTTNRRHRPKKSETEKTFNKGVNLKKGAPFGEFNLGSTIVVIFEIPSSLKLTVKAGDRVRMGQSIVSAV